MYATAQKEQFSLAYVHAVASVAGFSLFSFNVDDDSIDIGIGATGYVGAVRSPRIELQLKCTELVEGDDVSIKHKLKRKNYDDLRPTDLHVPRFLVVTRVPDDTSQWLTHTEEELVLRRCAYWVSLRGEPDRDQQSITVTLPRNNVFDVAGLTRLVESVGKGVTSDGRP